MKQILKSNNYYGQFLILIGMLLLVPLVTIVFYPQDIYQIYAFLIPAFIAILLGLGICYCYPKRRLPNHWRSSIHEGSLTVLYAWFIGIVLGALPFVISGQLSFVQALFEAVSGWTTTGLSVVDVTKVNHLFQFHRCFMQFCGGLGFIMMILFFVQENQAASLYDAEGHPDRLEPRLIDTVRMIFGIYFISLVIGSVLYYVFGMNWFDSLFHAMCSLSTGGFSTQVDSIGAYRSVAIEWVTIFLMVIGTTNFAVLLLMVKRKWKQVIKISELRLFSILAIVFTFIVAVSLSYSLYINFSESLRIAIFNVVSALSTTGYATMPYQNWPTLAVFALIILMLIGGGYGSTAGGMKLTRIYIAFQTLRKTFRQKLSSKRSVNKIYHYRAQGKTEINATLMQDTLSYILIYFIIFLIGTGLITFFLNCDLQSAMFEFASALGTVGLSIGLTGPETPAIILIIEMCGMLLGRLEIFVVFIGISALSYKLKV
ncbi:TrkH family potassium uptake protein [Candidatus Stoquefichus massiliensis]|uniref:TrkH family potassium uptake protein n=1 Tax=Candidatus Stoquefichus massiliensis TaxID=1470350 RepID=UPI000481B34F|nr:potassium transporter TrkG [Candidatus Stoquefichus massiliensis]